VSYADEPTRLARLLRDLADALEEAGVNPSGSSRAKHLMDDARRTAREIDPKERRKPGHLRSF
jgi:truncated hemoglobin YjbI